MDRKKTFKEIHTASPGKHAHDALSGGGARKIGKDVFGRVVRLREARVGCSGQMRQ